MKVIVIADDLTGAAEVAGAALWVGLTAEVQLGQLEESAADVVVIDADTRSLRPQAAAVRALDLTTEAIRQRPDFLFKKVDSVLRGSVASEIDAMLAAAGLNRCLLVCGNPRKHRTVVGGKIYVRGVPLHHTEFADDPEHPRQTNNAVELLHHPSSIQIGDAQCVDDLLGHARTWKSERGTTLAAGGAEFFEAVLANEIASQTSVGVEEATNDRLPGTAGEVLLISGSSMTRCDDWPTVPINPSQAPREIAATVCQTMSLHGRAAIRAIDIDGGIHEQRIEMLSEIASRVLTNCRPSEVWIEGGRTASTLMRELGYQRLKAVANAGDGIVALRSVDERSPLYLMKPGSYPWMDRRWPASAATATRLSNQEASPSRTFLRLLLLFLLWTGLLPAAFAQDIDFAPVANVLSEQCLDCHDAQTREGTVDLSRFQTLGDVDQDRELWKTLFDVVEAGQMPLPESGYELAPEQRETLLAFAREALARPDPKLAAIDPGKPILRRLTRLEYNNTVRDLFGLDYDIFMFPERLPVADKTYFIQTGGLQSKVVETSMREYGQKYDVLLPQLGLPGDNRAEHGYANRGDALNFSPLLFEKYLEMAAAIASSDRLLADSRVLQELLNIEPPKLDKASITSRAVPLSGDFAARRGSAGKLTRTIPGTTVLSAN